MFHLVLTPEIVYIYVFGACALGFTYGVYNWFYVLSLNVDEKFGESEASRKNIPEDNLTAMKETANNINSGAYAFLLREYLYIFIFLTFFAGIIVLTDHFSFYTTVAFGLGALTSLISGYIGMMVATKSNIRVTFAAATYTNDEDGLKNAFNVAFRGGCVMGFCLVSLALSVLAALIFIYIQILKPNNPESYTMMFEYLCGYGLGGSSVALFCRVGGGIYTKAADVGADLVGKNELGFDEDSPKNPATVADNVGDNVGDIAGMGADLFGSFAESTVAALVVSGTSKELLSKAYFFYPLLISATGILICLITSFIALYVMTVTHKDKIEVTLKWQLIISSILLTPAIFFLSFYCLPEKITFTQGEETHVTYNWGLMVCCLSGLWSGLIIGYFTDYFTSNAHEPTQHLAMSCKSGAAINVIQGLALGYMSCVIPIICISATIYLSFTFAGMYGLAIAALGMLSNLSTSLAIDAYGPISDNAGGISEMAMLEKTVRTRTDALDAAGNTTAAIGKGFAIGSACLVSLALFGAFLTRTKLNDVNILEPIEIASLVVGAMIPFWFSAFTMKSVGMAAAEMCIVIKKQIQNQKLDHMECVAVSTNASLKEMILPGVLVIFSPLITGFLFGPKAVAGYLAGVIVSGVQMAISSSNTGGAWDNAKKYIEAGNLRIEEEDRKSKGDKMVTDNIDYFPKKSKPHKAAVVGDTVGDPLKDTSGPSLNILIKLSAIVSLVFGSFFEKNYLFKA